MTKRKKYIIVVLIILFFLSSIFLSLMTIFKGPGFGRGSIGLRPVTHGCIGLIIPLRLSVILPNGDYGEKIKYRVMDNRSLYCLGQDAWWGE